MDLGLIIAILSLHFVGDFIFQSDWMAINKSKSNFALGIHVVTYSIPLCLLGFWWAGINGILHGGVDFVTSRITAELWIRQQRHWFFVVVGADQLIHSFCLFGTWFE
jgi:hypothetical protein